MSRWYEFSNSEYEMDSLGELRGTWANIPNQQAKEKIAEAHQYFNFQKEMILGRLRSWSHSPEEREDWFRPSLLALSARVGAINNIVLTGASIIECALRAHAEAKDVSLHGNPTRRTFGHVLNNSLHDPTFGPVLASIRQELELIKDTRDGIHLYATFDKGWEDIYQEEEHKLEIIERLFSFFQELEA